MADEPKTTTTPPTPVSPPTAAELQTMVEEAIRRLTTQQPPANSPGNVPAPAAPVPNPPVASTTVTVERERLEALLALEKRAREQEEEAKRHAEELALKRGEFQTVLKAREAEIEVARQEKATAEQRFKTTLRSGELARALAGKPLVPGAADQLMRLWESDFEAYPDGQGYRVLTKDYKAVADEVEARLADSRYAHFLLPRSGGGAGATGGGRPGPNPEPEVQPRNLGEAVAIHFQEVRKQAADDWRAPIGLKPRSRS